MNKPATSLRRKDATVTLTNDHFYQQISESVKLVFDLTSRIDERVKILVEKHGETNQRIEKIMERHENILSRISVLENKSTGNLKDELEDLKRECQSLEIKVATLEHSSTSHENKWKTMSDFVFKIAVAVIAGIIAWKLGVK